MNNKRSIMCIILFFVFFCGVVGFAAPARSIASVDNSLYAGLLEKYANNGVVDYQGFKNEEAKLDRYLKVLEETDTKALDRNEQFAFYINAKKGTTLNIQITQASSW